jgi:tungstate transport system substrate-binding protein
MAMLLTAALLAVLVGCGGGGGERFRVATTTSLYDTGLWDYLEPLFEDKYDVEMDIIYAGTGKALEWGQRKDVDAIAVHSKSHELKFIEEGYGVERVPFAYNYFLVVGPPDDPAGIKGMAPEAAFTNLMEQGRTRFISRGDDSGTHGKEKVIWQAAGYDYDKDVRSAGTWYVEGGSGMGPTLNMANEMLAYTLSDVGTYLAFKGNIALVPIVDGGDILLNVYSVIAVAQKDSESSGLKMARNLIDFLASDEIQEFIDEYSVDEYGMQLFTPCAGAEPQ